MKECYKPKTSDEIQKASEEYILETHIDDASVQDHFIAGAEWMQERMIEKAVEWMKEEMCYRDQSSGRGHWGEIETLGVYDSLEEFIDDFKKAMEEEK